jgi:hypothetical protein
MDARMTVTDLRLRYKQEFGEYPPSTGDHWIREGDDRWVLQGETQDYINWLEEELIFIRNNFGISNRVLDMTKKSKI